MQDLKSIRGCSSDVSRNFRKDLKEFHTTRADLTRDHTNRKGTPRHKRFYLSQRITQACRTSRSDKVLHSQVLCPPAQPSPDELSQQFFKPRRPPPSIDRNGWILPSASQMVIMVAFKFYTTLMRVMGEVAGHKNKMVWLKSLLRTKI